MMKRLQMICFLAISSQAFGQGVAFFQDGVTEVADGLYEGTIDTEFRAAAPTVPQFENINISIDQFDGGFQTQGALRFENLLLSDGGLIPELDSRDKLIFAELQIWKQSPSQSDANIDFNRIIGRDTTSGAFWDEEDTWASLGGDLIPDAAGLLDGDPIMRDGVEAAADFEFQDTGARFAPDAVVTLNPNDPPALMSLVYTTDADSEDVFDDAWDGSDEDLQRAIDVAFWRFDVTEALRDWLVDTDPDAAGTQPAQENLGWAISNDTGDGWDYRSSEVVDAFESEFSDIDTKQFRPALTIIFDDGSAGPLDINKDRNIDLADYELFLDLIGSELDNPLPTGAAGDFDFNRKVDLDDFKFFKENYPGGEAGLQAALASVPEPSATLLVMASLTLLSLVRRRR